MTDSAPAIGDVLRLRAADPRVTKFWVYVVASFSSFLGWMYLYSWAIGVKLNSANTTPLAYVDVWYAFVLVAALDALMITLNFNRALLHQWHYFVSLRMAILAFLAPLFLYLLERNGIDHLGSLYNVAVVLGCAGCCLALYVLGYVLTEWAHRFLPAARHANGAWLPRGI